MSILVACIGNIFQGDDAFGCEVAKVLARRPPSDDVRVVDFGIRGLDLTYALLDAPDLTILVDAVSRGAAPGTLYTIEPDLDENEGDSGTLVDAHAMDPVQVLRAAKAMGGQLRRVLLVGCEPADLGGEQGRMGLTPPVSSAIEPAAEMVESLIGKELREQQ
ncbi:MAG: hydrogenase maturation protease [Bryobacteraceae bacterium]